MCRWKPQQRACKTKEETPSSITCIKSIFSTALDEVYKQRDVAVVDIHGTFLQSKASNGSIIKLHGAVVETLLKINPTWNTFVVYMDEKQVPTICSEAIKVLYGTVDASKIFSFLVETIAFSPNPYNACIVNKIIDSKQCTISLYIDDLKISHKDANVANSIIKSLDDKYGSITPLSVSR